MEQILLDSMGAFVSSEHYRPAVALSQYTLYTKGKYNFLLNQREECDRSIAYV